MREWIEGDMRDSIGGHIVANSEKGLNLKKRCFEIIAILCILAIKSKFQRLRRVIVLNE